MNCTHAMASNSVDCQVVPALDFKDDLGKTKTDFTYSNNNNNKKLTRITLKQKHP